MRKRTDFCHFSSKELVKPVVLNVVDVPTPRDSSG